MGHQKTFEKEWPEKAFDFLWFLVGAQGFEPWTR